MDLWQLNIFTKVVELKSFSKAGSAIHLSQPTVSSHIKDLEEHFDCRLIDRLGKEALPTKAGELLYGYAKRLLSLRDETETALSQFKGKTRGHLVIGGSTIPGGYILPQVIGKFLAQFPDVTMALEISDTDKIIASILDGQIEVGLVGAPNNDKNLMQEPLIKDELSLIIPGDHPWKNRKSIDPSMLKDEPFIGREHGSGTLKSLTQSLMDSGFDASILRIVATMGNTAAVRQGVKSGIGVSVLSPLAVEDDLKNGSLKALSIEGIDLTRHFYLTMHKAKTPSPLCKSFVDFLKTTI
ncbi:MAG: LysR family transcriptional regulator [Proteobacteria bacterium]|nr:LysR family transcriptional regulator [Pseudomonadota bacterium]